MKRSCWCAVALAGALAACSVANAGTPIAGVTYEYNPPLLANPDDGNGEFTWNFAGKDLAQSKLTDGVLGTLDHIPNTETVAFTNGTWVGYSAADGAVGHPRVDLDLGGVHQVQAVRVQYLIEAPPFIFAPQPVDFESDGTIDVNAMTILGSTDGVSFSPLDFTNDFEPIFGPDGSDALKTVDARFAEFDFGPGGTTASHIRVDVHTPFTWVFLGEIIVEEVPEPGAASLAALAGIGLFVRRRK